MLTDTVGDLLTRIRNAQLAQLRYVDVKNSKENVNIIKVLLAKRFVQEMHLFSEKNIIRILLKYDVHQKPVITQIKRVSTPGQRMYTDANSIPVIKRGLGIVIISTSKGVMDGLTAKHKRVGGEVLCSVC